MIYFEEVLMMNHHRVMFGRQTDPPRTTDSCDSSHGMVAFNH